MRERVLFHCQHSLGLGHLVRSFALAEGLAGRFDVWLAVGGALPERLARPAGVRLLELPPLAMGDDGALVSVDPRWSVPAALEARGALLHTALDRLAPDAIVVEMWPFGRKKLTPEITGLLEAARRLPRPPCVVSSVRDVLVRSRADQQRHDDRAAALASEHLDAVWVHGDPMFLSFDASFRPSHPLRVPVHHTGLVARRTLPEVEGAPRGDHVLVSGGGGRFAGDVYAAALQAFDLGARPMRIVTGPFAGETLWRCLALASAERPGLELLREVPDLAAELAHCAVSVSQAGYNTTADLLRTRTPAVLVPFHVGREDEQMQRAGRLAEMGLASVLAPSELDGTRLLRAIMQARERALPSAAVRLGGAERSGALLEALLAERRARVSPAPRPECGP